MRLHIFKAAWVSSFVLIVTLGLGKSQTAQEWSGFYPESYARKIAINTAMPIYPDDAIQRGMTGVGQAKIAINDRGEVAQIRINPVVDASLKQAVADAVDKWTFRLRSEVIVPGKNSLSRLTFRFSIAGSDPRVEMYSPGPGAKDSEHLGHWNGATELSQWTKWEEVQASKVQQ
jgi:hypothetical protein